MRIATPGLRRDRAARPSHTRDRVGVDDSFWLAGARRDAAEPPADGPSVSCRFTLYRSRAHILECSRPSLRAPDRRKCEGGSSRRTRRAHTPTVLTNRYFYGVVRLAGKMCKAHSEFRRTRCIMCSLETEARLRES